MHRHDIDELEFRRFVRRTAEILSKGDSHLADDVEQHTHAALLSSEPGKIRNPHGWARTVARNYLRLQRNVGWKRPIHTALTDEVEGDTHEPLAQLETREARSVLHERLRRLPARDREVLQLRFMEGLPPREVAARLGAPVSTVRSRTRRAVERLVELYPEETRETAVRSRRFLFPLPFLGWLRRPRVAAGATAFVAAGAVAAVLLGTVPAHDTASGTSRTRVPDQGAPATVAIAAAHERAPAATAAPVVSGAPAGLVVRVVDADGRPRAGAEVFAAETPTSARMVAIGRTADDGTLLLPRDASTPWVAARGAPGELASTRGALRGAIEVELELRPVDVAWFDVDPSLWSPPEGATFHADPTQPMELLRLDPEDGLVGLPVGIPAWRDAQGRHGVAWGASEQHVVLMEDGEILWRSAPFDAGERPRATFTIEAPWWIEGRVVSRAGAPLADRPVLVGPDGVTRRHRVQVRTDGEGRFRLRVADPTPVVLEVGGATNLGVEPPTVPGGTVDGLTVTVARVDEEPLSRGRLHGVEGVRGVRYVVRHETAVWPALRFARGDVPTEEVELRPDGTFEIPLDAADIAAVLVDLDPAGGPDVPWITGRRPGLWAGDRIELQGPPPAPATVVLDTEGIDAARGGVHTLEACGVFRTVELEADANGRFVAHLPPGRCTLALAATDGRVLRWTGLELAPGETLLVDDPERYEARVRIDWSAVVAAGDPGDVLRVRTGNTWSNATHGRVTRARLGDTVLAGPLAAGQHVFFVEEPSGRAWGGAALVGHGEDSAVTPIEDPTFLRITSRKGALADAIRAAGLEVLDADGRPVVTVPAGTLLPAQLDLAVPPSRGWTVTTNATGANPRTRVVPGPAERQGMARIRPLGRGGR